MSNPAQEDPFVWKMRRSVEPIPGARRDLFRAARGIFWWSAISLLFWSALVYFGLGLGH